MSVLDRFIEWLCPMRYVKMDVPVETKRYVAISRPVKAAREMTYEDLALAEVVPIASGLDHSDNRLVPQHPMHDVVAMAADVKQTWDEEHLLRDTLAHHDRRALQDFENEFAVFGTAKMPRFGLWDAESMSVEEILFRRCEAAAQHRYRVTGECGYPCFERADIANARMFHFPEEIMVV